MLRYRVAFDPERGHFVLPALSGMVSPEETFSSRTAAQRMAHEQNSRAANILSMADSGVQSLPMTIATSRVSL
jgi:hypothetical protein